VQYAEIVNYVNYNGQAGKLAGYRELRKVNQGKTDVKM